MTIDNSDGLLQFYDLSGNPCYVGEKTVKLPMSIFPSYITCAKGPEAAAERWHKRRSPGSVPSKFCRGISKPCLPTRMPPCRWSSQLSESHDQGQAYGEIPLGDYTCSTQQEVVLAAGETKTMSLPIHGDTARVECLSFRVFFRVRRR